MFSQKIFDILTNCFFTKQKNVIESLFGKFFLRLKIGGLSLLIPQERKPPKKLYSDCSSFLIPKIRRNIPESILGLFTTTIFIKHLRSVYFRSYFIICRSNSYVTIFSVYYKKSSVFKCNFRIFFCNFIAQPKRKIVCHRDIFGIVFTTFYCNA